MRAAQAGQSAESEQTRNSSINAAAPDVENAASAGPPSPPDSLEEDLVLPPPPPSSAPVPNESEEEACGTAGVHFEGWDDDDVEASHPDGAGSSQIDWAVDIESWGQ